jgi:Zn-dependent protease with chaperone function
MSLFLFLSVILSLACGGIPAATAPSCAVLIGPIALLLIFAVLARTAASNLHQRVREGLAVTEAAESLAHQLDALRWFGLAVSLICLVPLRMAAAAQTWVFFSSSMLLQAIFLLTPALLTIAMTLAAEHRFDVLTGQTPPSGMRGARRLPRMLFRFAGWLVAPILVMLAIADVIVRVWPSGDLTWAGIPAIGWAMLSVLVALPLLVPWLAKRVWKTEPLEDPQHRWLVDLTRRVGGAGLEVRRWDTGMRDTNAAVIGLFPHARSLLLTDRLLRDSSADQLYLIALHELAHLRRGHLWLRMLAVTPAWLLAAAWIHFVDAGSVSFLTAHVLAILATLVSLRIVAHATEYDADRVACDLAARLASTHPVARSTGAGWGAAKEQVERFCATLRQADGSDEASSKRISWLHPSVDARCRALRAWVSTVGDS